MSKKNIKREIETDFRATNDTEQAIAELTNLPNHPGFRRITEVLDKKIEEYAKEILDSDIQGEELNRLRDRRDLCMYFRNLPEILVGILNNPMSQVEPNFDPYETVDNPPTKK